MHNIGSVIRQKLQRGDSKPRKKKKEAKHTKYLSRSIADGRLETVVLHLFGYKVFTTIPIRNKGRTVTRPFHAKSQYCMIAQQLAKY